MAACGPIPEVEARSIELRCGRLAPSEARHWLSWLDDYLEPPRLYDARVMVSELVSNAVMHADLEAGDPIRLRVGVEVDRIRVSVWDNGRGFEPDDPPRRPQADVVGGLGLWLVGSLADGLTFDGPRGRVCFELAREGERAVQGGAPGP